MPGTIIGISRSAESIVAVCAGVRRKPNAARVASTELITAVAAAIWKLLRVASTHSGRAKYNLNQRRERLSGEIWSVGVVKKARRTTKAIGNATAAEMMSAKNVVAGDAPDRGRTASRFH